MGPPGPPKRTFRLGSRQKCKSAISAPKTIEFRQVLPLLFTWGDLGAPKCSKVTLERLERFGRSKVVRRLTDSQILKSEISAKNIFRKFPQNHQKFKSARIVTFPMSFVRPMRPKSLKSLKVHFGALLRS